MAYILKGVGEMFCIDTDVEGLKTATYDGGIHFPSNKVYQVITQTNERGQVGYGFVRMDNSLFPIEGDMTFNPTAFFYHGTLENKGQFSTAFENAIKQESARKSGIELA